MVAYTVARVHYRAAQVDNVQVVGQERDLAVIEAALRRRGAREPRLK